ncbi:MULTISPECIES: gephyrin-like molybdotransferase Glp [Clostridium]|uniref:Molybdopterin molybdenumtransferase n=1 Tax=Clostridium tertium TaxID=1559 RepID=A0A9X3XLH8_9CLOT|nr:MULTISPECIES: gephyrin-like molybdotransferase Glp [Clostridium]MBU6135071.1 molybdopterin molybdotransferase MoeA [Clostridium tertium]MDB1955286.1 molybdopterin molybdotransferase MoeA [Clostridium tertium]MDB1959667.1 molybdopterin molybdotransferase MoeA [Clostridium tertium]MDB1963534.1 molybdopterin molybdotransferase MoeA [Clostridium tertium]MDB1966191.1 molybdopterin molybdotransferase MoeA [Clostridium tertium]
MKSFISLEEAIEILNNNVNNLDIEEVDLIDGLNRVISENIYAQINNPPFNKSAMDGYALISNNTELSNRKFKVIDKVYAGGVCSSAVNEDTAVRIMTGAPIPKGANAVIKQEDVTLEDDFIILKKNIKENENICIKGEDISKGSLLLKSSKKLDYADIGILASSGINKMKVYKKPKIAFISTGDEVVDIGLALGEGKIYNSNKYSILSRIKELGYEAKYIAHINDNFHEIGSYIEEISNEVDLIITTGGVSVGEKDLLKDAIDTTSGEKLFWKITIKPGSAVLCSRVNKSIVISLSGNPTAALTTFELLVKPTLEKLSGYQEIKINREKAILSKDIKKKSPQRRFIRGYVEVNNCKQYVHITQTKSGNGILSSAINSNCIIEIETNNDGKNQGDLVDIIKL